MSAEAKEIHEQRLNLMLELIYMVHGRRQRGGGGRVPPLIFIHDTDIVERGLIVLFLGLFLLFFRSLFPLPLCFLFCYFSVFVSFFSVSHP